VAGRRVAAGLAAAAVALTAAGCSLGGSTKTVTVTHTHTVTTTRTVTSRSAAAPRPCLGADLAGTFAIVPGSAGAGQISYLLTLKNTSPSRCYVQGLPKATLLGVTGSALPTHVRAAGSASSGRVVLEPGASAIAHARFSPDVAGSGDSQTGACQPQAHTLEVTPNGGGPTDAAIRPPTSVCEQGTLNFETFGYAP
jgi:Domain of unknown function (DUF4232)